MKECRYFINQKQSMPRCRGVASIELVFILPFLLSLVLLMTAIAQIVHVKMTVNTETRTAAWRLAQFQSKCAWAVSSEVSADLARLRVTRPLRISCNEINWRESRVISGSASQFLNDMESAGEKEAIKTIRNDGISPAGGDYVGGFARTIADSGLPQTIIAYGEATYSAFSTASRYTSINFGDFKIGSQFVVEADTNAVWSMDANHLSKGHNVKFAQRMDAPKSILFPEFFP